MMIVDISGLNKAEVLKTLWDNSKSLGMSVLGMSHEFRMWYQLEMIAGGKGDKIPLEFAEKGIQSNPTLHFDYFEGRVIKCDISGDTFDSTLYDRDNGEGSAQAAIDKLCIRYGISYEFPRTYNTEILREYIHCSYRCDMSHQEMKKNIAYELAMKMLQEGFIKFDYREENYNPEMARTMIGEVCLARPQRKMREGL